MASGHDELDTGEAAPLEADEEVAPARSALPVGDLDGEDLALPFQSLPTAISIA